MKSSLQKAIARRKSGYEEEGRGQSFESFLLEAAEVAYHFSGFGSVSGALSQMRRAGYDYDEWFIRPLIEAALEFHDWDEWVAFVEGIAREIS